MNTLERHRAHGPARIVAIVGVVALAAGTAAGQAPDTQYSPRLGISYRLVPYGGAAGAVLTEAPAPGSPMRQEQVELEPGDMITHLDGNPIADPAELERHRGQTSVQFVNVRTGAAEARWVYLPAMGAPPVPRSAGPVERGRGRRVFAPAGDLLRPRPAGRRFGARLKADPVPGSPALQEQVQLEAGDIITHLDGRPIAGPAELENHHGQTSVHFVNVRSGGVEARWLFLPAMTDPGVPPPSPPRPRPAPPSSSSRSTRCGRSGRNSAAPIPITSSPSPSRRPPPTARGC